MNKPLTVDLPTNYWGATVTKKPKTVYGVYDIDELQWIFFVEEQPAVDFQSQDTNRIGPHQFPFDSAMEQFSNDLCKIPDLLFVTEGEFAKVVKGEEVEFSLLSPESYDEEEDSTDTDEESSRPELSEGDFKDMEEALKSLRSAAEFVLVETDFPTSYAEMEEEISEMEWKIIEYDGMGLLDFVKGLSLICTVLRPEIFEQTLHELLYGDEEEDEDD
jgi:hypothetical protein